MKKTILALCLATAGTALAQKPIKVKGTIDDASVTKLYLQVGDENNFGSYLPQETIEVKKGKFSFTKSINKIVIGKLMRQPDDQASYMSIFLVPGENLVLSVKGSEYFYDGSKIYKECDATDRAITPLHQELTNYYTSALSRLQGLTEEEQQKIVKGLQDTLTMKANAYENAIQTVRDAKLNEEGAVLYLSDITDVEKLYSDLNDDIKNGRVGEFLKARVDQIAEMRKKQEEAAAAEQAKIGAMSGAPAKDFTLNDINGNPLSLSSLRGKYVILDFWGSWCGWCIKGIPDMKKYYEKYAGKFEILGIDCNDTEEAWKKAVEKYELPWLHVYNPKGSTVLSDYSIQGFPTKIVIDPNGNIAKVIVGEDPAFYTYLDDLFSK